MFLECCPSHWKIEGTFPYNLPFELKKQHPLCHLLWQVLWLLWLIIKVVAQKLNVLDRQHKLSEFVDLSSHPRTALNCPHTFILYSLSPVRFLNGEFRLIAALSWNCLYIESDCMIVKFDAALPWLTQFSAYQLDRCVNWFTNYNP